MGTYRIKSIQLNVEEKKLNLSGIYKIYSIIHPNKIYIGSAATFRDRYRNHRSTINRNKHYSKKLQNYANKYGSEILIFEIIEIIEDRNLLLEREQHWIDELNPFFNTVPYAIPTRKGCHLTENGRKRISLSKIGNNYGKGHKMSDELKKKLSKIHKGRKLSNEQREFIRKINTGVKQPKNQVIKRMISILGEDRIKKVKEIQYYFDSKVEKENKYGDDVKYLSEKYGFDRKIINNIRSGRMYSNFRNYEL